MIKNPSGRLVPIRPGMTIPPEQKPKNTLFKLKGSSIIKPFKLPVHKPPGTRHHPIAPFLVVTVVKKRNILLEQQGIPDIEKYDVYEVISFHNTEKAGSVSFVNFKPSTDNIWRVTTKYVKQIPYNTMFDLDLCKNTYEENL